MNPHYSAFVELGKSLAAERALQWEIPEGERAPDDGPGFFGAMCTLGNDRSGVDRGHQNPRCA